MPSRDVVLGPEDSTIFAKCEACCRQGVGTRTDRIYAKAFPPRKWVRNPKCENCKGPLTFLYEVT